MSFEYLSLDDIHRKFDSLDVNQLPILKGVPMSVEESNYRTYYALRLTNDFKMKNKKDGGEVYLISDNINTVKIGISKDVPQRFRAIEMASGRKLTLLATYKPTSISYKKLERDLFKRYADNRAIGEWFDMLITKEEFLNVCHELDYLR